MADDDHDHDIHADEAEHAKLALEQGDHDDDAVNTLKTALSSDPNNADNLYNLGHALQLEEEHDDAKAHFAKALAVDPNHADTNFSIAQYAIQDKQNDAAIAALRKAIASKPGHVLALRTLGELLVGQGGDARSEAIQLFTRAIAADPSDVQLRARLLQALDQAGQAADFEAARKSLHDAFAAGQLNPSFSQVGRYCCSQFEVGGKFVMAFDYVAPQKFVFNVFNKGAVHDDKIIASHTKEGGSFHEQKAAVSAAL